MISDFGDLQPVELGNSRFRVSLEPSGAGHSRFDDILLTRQKDDLAANDLGVFFYIRDVESGEFWSAGACPARPGGAYGRFVRFGENLALYGLEYSGISARTAVTILPEQDAEVRRLTLCNTSPRERLLDVTSYAEPVLASPAADSAHPAFYKLFLETRIHANHNAILCSRRPRSKEEKRRFLVHAMQPRQSPAGPLSFETDRYRFLGRGNTPACPGAMRSMAPLSGSEGAVLDPVLAIRCPIRLLPGQCAHLDLLQGTAPDAASCLALTKRFAKESFVTQALALAGDNEKRDAPLEAIPPAVWAKRPDAPVLPPDACCDQASNPGSGPAPAQSDSPCTLQLANKYGGFSPDGKEYVIRLSEGENTPLPWVNVIAGPHFGTVISESGSAYTFYRNAREFRLTPWHNDPVSDPSGEAVFIQDCESAEYWSPTPLPARGTGEYTIRHGFGYSLFSHEQNGIASEMCVFIAPAKNGAAATNNGNDAQAGNDKNTRYGEPVK
ncbi:hypothetical protein LJC46_10205, partial [Desulfovibrio sp. OttesenSCG-928-G15]|nr:hypothetical protein [Desulfovibrio sp. OttesenSCG-928-G15]